jgi:ferric-dicitrate binding protein FerR (iron transport regulator)
MANKYHNPGHQNQHQNQQLMPSIPPIHGIGERTTVSIGEFAPLQYLPKKQNSQNPDLNRERLRVTGALATPAEIAAIATQMPKKPGLVAREQQLAAAESERNQFTAEAGSPITGNVSTQQAVRLAKSALKRQQNYRARGSAY